MAARDRYSLPIIAIHWITVLLVAANLGLAWRFDGLEGAERGALIRMHKSIGITVLLLTVARALWKAIDRPPAALPSQPWERRLARLVHAGFYVVLVLMPLSGWAMISADKSGRPTEWFGLVPWPRIALLADLPPERKELAHGLLSSLHLSVAIVLCLLVAMHLAAVAKHQFLDGQRPIRRMRP